MIIERNVCIMKRKILFLSVVAALAFSTSACGNNKTSNTDKVTQKQELEKDSSNSSVVNDEEVNNTQESKDETSLEDLEKYLLEKGVLTGSKTETLAQMIGAKAGFKYQDSNAEFYEYDTNSDDYKALSSGSSIEFEEIGGVSISASAINGQYVLISSGELSQELLDAFNSYGK